MNRLEDIQALAKTLPIRKIPDPQGGYMDRYQLHGFMPFHPITTPCAVYLHNILRADEDPALHSHPWEWTCTMVLHGGYLEKRGEVVVDDQPHVDSLPRLSHQKLERLSSRALIVGTSALMTGNSVHRIASVEPDTWTLFFTGPKRSSWGFFVEGRGMVPWRERLRERGLEPAY